jgi:aspartyl-tRNA(Asn)/glutamyl-tRNA(Gln) amidotransferase subunit A
MTDLAFITIAEASRLIRARKLSPVELTAALLARIAALDGLYHAYIAVMAETTLAQAKVAEAEIMAGTWRGCCTGCPTH